MMLIRDVRIAPMDEHHCVAHVDTAATYARKDQSNITIDFTVHYLVQMLDNDPKVFDWGLRRRARAAKKTWHRVRLLASLRAQLRAYHTIKKGFLRAPFELSSSACPAHLRGTPLSGNFLLLAVKTQHQGAARRRKEETFSRGACQSNFLISLTAKPLNFFRGFSVVIRSMGGPSYEYF